jgi:hypothetical protein
MGFFSPEEPPMTMQIAMIGTDGIVLASDRKWGGDTGGSRETHHAPKIKFSEQRGIAVMCSESEISLNIATNILNEFKESDHELPCLALERIALSAMQGFNTARIFPQPQSHCLIALKGKSFRLYSLKVGPEGQNCTEIFDKRRAGDPGNPAMFFAQAYYAPRQIKKLAFLGAHIVLTAAQFNSDGIGGLEILLCDKRGFRMLSSDEIKELKKRSSTLHKTISRALR